MGTYLVYRAMCALERMSWWFFWSGKQKLYSRAAAAALRFLFTPETRLFMPQLQTDYEIKLDT